MRDIISLNGLWDWNLPGGPVQKRPVPSCYFCVGDAYYSREFALPELAGKRVVLHFEGVHYTGAVTAALKAAGSEGVALICGSLYLAGVIRPVALREALREARSENERQKREARGKMSWGPLPNL